MVNYTRPIEKEQPESAVLKAVKQMLQADGWLVIRHQQSFGSYKGFPDLTAIKNGNTIYIECKTKTGKLGKWQVQFKADLEAHGGTYIVARSTEDVLPHCTTIQSMF